RQRDQRHSSTSRSHDKRKIEETTRRSALKDKNAQEPRKLKPKSKPNHILCIGLHLDSLKHLLESIRIKTQSVNANVSTLSRGREKEKHKPRRDNEDSHEEGYGSYHSYQDPKVVRGDFFVKLQRMYQGTKCMEEYF
ncbi:hypothetical protein CR513_03566, partial [Mucuna pruriens]